MWGPVTKKVLLNCMYWAYDPMAQSEDGQIKVIMGRKSEEVIKIVYDNPKYVRGESHLGDVNLR